MKFNQTCRLFTNFVLLAFLVFLTAISLNAQNRQLTQKKPDISKAARIALVIGNGEYTNARKLTNPVNDANDMAKTLNELGFEVISGTNLNLQQMTEKVREFGDKLKVSGGVGLFYYAGHGIQVNGRNYLIPVNADITREDEIDFAALNFDLILRKLATANNGLNIVVLDACRNNPFARSWSRDAGDGGLAQVTAPTGTFIAYATSPDRTASDGTGRNGLYTAELLKHIKQPNLKIEEAFKQVTIAVDQKSDGKQVPWTSSSLRGEFYFIKDGGTNNTNIPKTAETKEPTQQNNKISSNSRGNKSGKLLYNVSYSAWSSAEGRLNPLLEGSQGADLMNEFDIPMLAKLKSIGLNIATRSDIAFKDQAQITGGLNTRFKNEKALRFLPFALIFYTSFTNLRDMSEAYNLKVAVVSGSIDVIDTENGKTIASESFIDVRGFGNTQDQARRNALKAAAEGISETFLNLVNEKSR